MFLVCFVVFRGTNIARILLEIVFCHEEIQSRMVSYSYLIHSKLDINKHVTGTLIVLLFNCELYCVSTGTKHRSLTARA